MQQLGGSWGLTALLKSTTAAGEEKLLLVHFTAQMSFWLSAAGTEELELLKGNFNSKLQLQSLRDGRESYLLALFNHLLESKSTFWLFDQRGSGPEEQGPEELP